MTENSVLDKKSLRALTKPNPDWDELAKSRGKTKGTTYYVEPSILRKHEFKGRTSLRNIAPHRLDALIVEDLSQFGKSSISEIHERVGKEIPVRTIRHHLSQLVNRQDVERDGGRRGTKYFIDKRTP